MLKIVMNEGTAAVSSDCEILNTEVNILKSAYNADLPPVSTRKRDFYEKYVKHLFDIICTLMAIIVFSPLYLTIAILVRIKLGSPIIFRQYRPGIIGKDGQETFFKIYKFRTMTDDKDKNGNLLSDEKRLTGFGKWLRSTSLDELPEAFNILNGTMSIIGPRPQLVKDMLFMTAEQRMRHTARPGLSGLAQINGRNSISWENKMNYDIKYIENISLKKDIEILLSTVKQVFISPEELTDNDTVMTEDLGDYLLRTQKIDKQEYDRKQKIAESVLKGTI